MSDQSLDIREQIARLDRTQAETAKFAAEQRKLAAEAQQRERHLRQLLIAAVTAGAAIVGATAAIVKLLF